MAQLYYPLPKSLVTEWPGDRDGGNVHYGTDFGVPVDTPLPACFDGEIVFAGGDGAHGELYPGAGIWANGQGLTVDMRRKDGLIARCGHLNRIKVKVGQKVRAGDIIGLSGNTGFTTGPHCHWELRWDRLWSGGRWVDPRKLGAKDLPRRRQRRKAIGSKGAQVRLKPTTKSKAIRFLKAGTIRRVTTWTHGERVNGSDIWIRVRTGLRIGWVHASEWSVMTPNTTHLLKELK